jgi:Ca2+-binding EF-hand superfamily protein
MRLELTESQRAEIRQAFDLFDTDGRGALHADVRC